MPKFVSEFDFIPSFWEFLKGLNPNDLIAELIQNDLDQDATRTVVTFSNNCLTCEGNGNPVDDDGWRRLRVIQGAGDKVPAKQGKIGVKNHGLKTAFALGDQFQLMSAGKGIEQTLYAKGPDKPPYPGASDQPFSETCAPSIGCRVVIPYRTKAIMPDTGEAMKLEVPDESEVDEVFKKACSVIPEQFAGIVSPGNIDQYEIVLKHWRFGSARFDFSCSRARKMSNGIETFTRKCEVTGDAPSLPENLYERGARRLFQLGGQLKKRCSDFYRKDRRFFVEVSWPIKKYGKPIVGKGRFRYPIGYPADSKEAYTGHSAYFNLPIVSDSKRHAPAPNEASFKQLRKLSERLLVDVLANDTIPRWRSDGLNPLVPNEEIDNAEEKVRPLLAELAARNKLPVLNWCDAVERSSNNRGRRLKEDVQRIYNRRTLKEKKKYAFVLPVATWDEDAICSILSILCPRSELQIDPLIHPKLIAILADSNTEGFCENFITFDETDVFQRVTAEGNQYFGAIANRNQEFANSFLAGSYLDLILCALDNQKLCDDLKDKLINSLLLPDSQEQAQHFCDLYSSNLLLDGIPGLNLPPILTPALVNHRLLRRNGWQLDKFTMSTFLNGGALSGASKRIRSQFWNWLRKNVDCVPKRDRTKLAELEIWPDHNGQLVPVSELCEPSSKPVASVLERFIRRPNREVKQSKLVSFGKRGRMSVRSKPTEDELTNWLNSQLAQFEIGEVANKNSIEAIERFEKQLSILLSDSAICRILKQIENAPIPTLAQDGTVQDRSTLVLQDQAIKRLSLPQRYLLKGSKYNSKLKKIAPALIKPDVWMIVNALEESPKNDRSLQPRLRILLQLADSDQDVLQKVKELPIIQINGKLWKPADLAIKGNKGDYWGNWKESFSPKGLSPEDQQRFIKIGVTRNAPACSGASMGFFRWLATLDEEELKQHIPCVIRHIRHPNGPENWAHDYTEIGCLPIENGKRIRLAAVKERERVYLADAGEKIKKQIMEKDSSVYFVLDKVKQIASPITEQCQRIGVKSLREKLAEPHSVSGIASLEESLKIWNAELDKLKAQGLRNTLQKRLVDFGVPSELIRNNWHNRLTQIQQIKVAETVKATYKFRGKFYEDDVDAGFDSNSGVYWVKKESGSGVSALYESIAKTIIFKPNAQPRDYLTLERAVLTEISNPSFGKFPLDADDVNARDPDSNKGETGDQETNSLETTEALFGHSPFEPDPNRNIPNPTPLPSTVPTNRGQYGGTRPIKRNSGGKAAPKLELKHKEELKTRHYASHCQVCLCKQIPQKLAPKDSYVYFEEIRRKVIDAHHVDPISGDGARHAGNLILLCKLHHENYGSKLTRTKVIQALKTASNSRTIHFESNHKIDGQVVDYEISDTGEIVKIFFTKDHAKYWLELGKEYSEGV